MAIPFVYPSDDETETNYQHLDQLLADLFNVLQQILITQRRIRDTQTSQVMSRMRYGQTSNSRRIAEGHGGVTSISPSEVPRLFTIPDNHHFDDNLASTSAILPQSSTLSSVNSATDIADPLRLGASTTPSIVNPKNSSRRRRRRRRTSSCCGENKSNTDIISPIQTQANQIGATSTTITATQDWTQDEQPSEDTKLPCGVAADQSDASLLSMLVPPAFGGSLWTAVIFVVGWRLLVSTR